MGFSPCRCAALDTTKPGAYSPPALGMFLPPTPCALFVRIALLTLLISQSFGNSHKTSVPFLLLQQHRRVCSTVEPVPRPLRESPLCLLIKHGLRHFTLCVPLRDPYLVEASMFGWGSGRCEFLVSLAGSITSPASSDALNSLCCKAASPGDFLHSIYHPL